MEPTPFCVYYIYHLNYRCNLHKIRLCTANCKHNTYFYVTQTYWRTLSRRSHASAWRSPLARGPADFVAPKPRFSVAKPACARPGGLCRAEATLQRGETRLRAARRTLSRRSHASAWRSPLARGPADFVTPKPRFSVAKAEGARFELAWAVKPACFPSKCHRPLGEPSNFRLTIFD